MKKGFTIIEITVVLMIVGIVTIIGLTNLNSSKPSENVYKFKHGNNLLLSTFKEMLSSDEYFLANDLGKKPNGEDVKYGDYFCKAFAKVIDAKTNSCDSLKNSGTVSENYSYTNEASINAISMAYDNACKSAISDMGNQIVTKDGFYFYETSPSITFASYYSNGASRLYSTVSGYTSTPYMYLLYNLSGDYGVGEYQGYKVFCMDIDGFSTGTSCDDNKDICPFAYLIRVDGKVVPSIRTQEWLEKEVNKS